MRRATSVTESAAPPPALHLLEPFACGVADRQLRLRPSDQREFVIDLLPLFLAISLEAFCGAGFGELTQIGRHGSAAGHRESVAFPGKGYRRRIWFRLTRWRDLLAREVVKADQRPLSFAVLPLWETEKLFAALNWSAATTVFIVW